MRSNKWPCKAGILQFVSFGVKFFPQFETHLLNYYESKRLRKLVRCLSVLY